MLGGVRGVAVAIALAMLAPASARAQCRRACVAGESRDPWGCCVAARRRSRRRAARTPQRTRPEALVGDMDAVLTDDVPTELYYWARDWLGRAREQAGRDRARGIALFRRAAGASLVFLHLAPDDRRAGRMRAVLVESLERAGMDEAAEREAEALGGPRPSPEPATARELRSDTLLNLAWAHQRIGQRLDGPRTEIRRRQLAVARFERAAAYYAAYVDAFGGSPASAGARSEHANALIAAGRPLDAARVLEAMADAVPARRVEGLRRAVDAYRRALAADVAAGRASVAEGPPPPSRRPPWTDPPAMPEPVRRLLEARDRYLAAAQTAPEGEPFRDQQVENALLLFRYGRFAEARPRLIRLLREACDDTPAARAAEALEQMQAPSTCEAVAAYRCSGSVTAPRCELYTTRP